MNTAHNKLCSEVRGYGRRAEIWVNLSTSSFHKYPYRDSNFHPEVVTPNTYVCYAAWIMAVTEGAADGVFIQQRAVVKRNAEWGRD